MNNSIVQFIKLGFIILLLGGVMWGIDYIFFKQGESSVCKQEQLAPERLCLETAFSKWGSQKIIWVDARSEGDFEVNHLRIADNRMFPIRPGERKQALINAAIERLMEAEEKGECIIIFCTKECTQAEDIRKSLLELELIEAPIYILEGGWDALKRDGTLMR